MNIKKLIASLPARSEAERSDMRLKAEAWLASGDVEKAAQAAELLSALNDIEAAAIEVFERTPLSKRVYEAFRRRPWSDNERKLIQSLLDHPGSTTTELNRLSGLGDNMVWQMHFGNMCKARTDLLGPPPLAEKRGAPFWSGLLADAEMPSNRFTMKPEATEAFARLGLKATK
ncbi:MAG: hypothetical protein ACK4FB_00200 [Brevundimonas sp.]|uniref:hypothetical protein n=1 Tax=Brevundimonas sp. TaxID=1871086 RepID=UPI00391D85B0